MRLRRLLLTAAFLMWTAGLLAAFHLGLPARFRAVELHAPRIVLLLAILAGFWWVGGLLGRPLGLGARRQPLAIPLRLALGLATLSYLWLSLALCGLLRPWLAWTVLAIGAAGGLVAVRRGRRVFTDLHHALAPVAPFPAVLAASGLILVLPMVLTPPTTTDALVYHLLLPHWYVSCGGTVALPDFAYAAFPAQVEMLYSWTLLLGQPIVAKLLHFSAGLIVVLVVALVAQREQTARAGWIGAAVLLTTPVFLLNMSWASVDAVVSLFVVCGCLELLRLRERPGHRQAILAGLLWGMALSVKYTAGLYFVVALVVCLWPPPAPANRRRLLAAMLVVVVVAMALVSPYLIRNTVIYANPTHPIGNSLWGPGHEGPFGLLYVAVEERSEPIEHLLGLFSYTLWSSWSDENPGFIYLLALPVLPFIAIRSSARKLWLVGLLCIAVLSFFFGGSVRFQLPALCLLAVPIGCWLDLWWVSGGARRATVTVLLVAVGISNLTVLALHNRVRFDPVQVALGYENESSYLGRVVESYRAADYLNTVTPEHAKVFALAERKLFYVDRQVVTASVLDVSPVRDWIREGGSAHELGDRFRREGISHLLFNRALFEYEVTDGIQTPFWEPHEVEILHQFLAEHAQEVLRDGPVELYSIPANAGPAE